MRNGNHLEGAVREQKTGYWVTLAGGGEIFLPNDKVELVAKSLEHVYHLKQAAARKGVVRDQLDMAEWCLRNRLLPYAADHLLTAMTLTPDHARIPVLQHRLRMAAEQQATDHEREQIATAPIASESPEPATAKSAFEPGDLRPGTLELFTSFVQPVLLNRCSAAACHGATSPCEFRLQRPGAGTCISRKITLHNLQAALALIDQDSPHNSPLLITPIGPHADLPQGLFASHEVGQLKRLAMWVQVATGRQGIQTAAYVEQPDQHLMQRLPGPGKASPGFGGRNFPANGPPADGAMSPYRQGNGPSAADEDSGEPRRLNTIDSRPIRGEHSAPDAVRQDPFDPALFNRRHHPSVSERPSENSPR